MKKTAISTLFALALTGLPLFAQVGQDLKSAGTDVKDATVTGAKKTGTATKKAYRKTKGAVKTGAHKTATATEKGASKVAGKTTSTANPPK